MQKKFMKVISICAVSVFTCAALVGCNKKDTASSEETSSSTTEAAVDVLDNSKLTEMPEGIDLSEDQMKNTMSAYAGYMSEALAADGYSVSVRYGDDGSVHFDGVKTSGEGEQTEIPDLTQFDSLSEAFAYLYNCGQADAEGNLLVSVSVSEDEAAESETVADESVESVDEAAEDTATEEVVSEAAEEVTSDAAAEETPIESVAEDGAVG